MEAATPGWDRSSPSAIRRPSSAAARREKVSRRTWSGEAKPLRMRWRARWTRNSVFPVPGPATTNWGPSTSATACGQSLGPTRHSLAVSATGSSVGSRAGGGLFRRRALSTRRAVRAGGCIAREDLGGLQPLRSEQFSVLVRSVLIGTTYRGGVTNRAAASQRRRRKKRRNACWVRYGRSRCAG